MHLLSETEDVSESQNTEFDESYVKRGLEPFANFFFPYLKEIGFEKKFSPICPELGGELNFEQEKATTKTHYLYPLTIVKVWRMDL